MRSIPLVALLLSLLTTTFGVSAEDPEEDAPQYDRFECKFNVHARSACNTPGDIDVLELLCENIYYSKYPQDLIDEEEPVRRNLRGGALQEEEEQERELLPDHCDPTCVTIPTDPWCVAIPGCGARRRRRRRSRRNRKLSSDVFDQTNVVSVTESTTVAAEAATTTSLGGTSTTGTGTGTGMDTVVDRQLPEDGTVITMQNTAGDTYAIAPSPLTDDILTSIRVAMSLHPNGLCQACFDKITSFIQQDLSPVDADEVFRYLPLAATTEDSTSVTTQAAVETTQHI